MAVTVTASASQTLDVLLELVCLRIQLTETQDQKARGHYKAVSSWLADEASSLHSFSPYIFPQGSQRLGTTTKPIHQSEFDLDAICRLAIYGDCHPGLLYRLLWDRLWQNAIYRPMMKRMPRCVRLDYAGDFHLDIAPAVPDSRCGGTCLLVPDLDANLALEHPQNDEWKSTNPQGHADWFEDKCVVPMVFNERMARAQVDPVPDQEPIHAKPALKRSVQLFKRWRDVEYVDRTHLAPPSIILTTLSGLIHQGEQLCTDALDAILDSVVATINSGKRIRLTNPAHDAENICEKWDSNPAAYFDFCRSVVAFRDRWKRLQRLRGIHEIEKELASLFGEAPVTWAINEMAQRHIVKPRDNGVLKVVPKSAGLLVPATAAFRGVSVRPNTFHGDAKR